MLVLGFKHQYISCAVGNARLASNTHVVPIAQLLRIQLTGRPGLPFTDLVGQRARDALSLAIDFQHLLGRPIELQKTLANLPPLFHSVPYGMSGETSIALIYERALEALLAFCRSEAPE